MGSKTPGVTFRSTGITRRRFLIRVISGTCAAGLSPLFRQRASALDNCYWETRQTACFDGRKRQYRCEVCCAGGVCQTVQCVWVDVGPC